MPATPASVLVVDDEAGIRDTTVALLEDDYSVAQSANARDALRILSTQHFDVICTDYRMPGMSGVELLKAAQKMHPGTSGIVVTAYADYPEYQAQFKEVSCLVLLKPYDPERLCEMVARSAKLSKMKQVAKQASSETERLAAELRKP